MLCDSFCSKSKELIKRDAKELHSTIRKAWNANRGNRDGYLKSIGSLSVIGKIGADGYPRIDGHEAQLAIWLSAIGKNVTFRDPNKEYYSGNRASDMLMDGDLWEAKRITSSNPQKIVKRITEKFDRQGPNFIVDLSVSEVPDEAAFVKLAKLLDDPKIERFLIVKNGKLLRMAK